MGGRTLARVAAALRMSGQFRTITSSRILLRVNDEFAYLLVFAQDLALLEQRID